MGDTPEASENKFTNKDECKEFAGWNTQKDGKGKTYQKGDQLDPLTGTTVLYAQWKTKDGCPAAPAALQELGKTGGHHADRHRHGRGHPAGRMPDDPAPAAPRTPRLT